MSLVQAVVENQAENDFWNGIIKEYFKFYQQNALYTPVTIIWKFPKENFCKREKNKRSGRIWIHISVFSNVNDFLVVIDGK